MRFNYSFDRRPVLHLPVTVGRYADVQGYRQALADKHIRLGDKADEILSKMSLCQNQRTVTICVASVSQLIGTQDKAITHSEILDHIKCLGGHLCTPEFGPALRLAYLDQPGVQPIGESIVIAMELDHPSSIRSTHERRHLSVAMELSYPFSIRFTDGRLHLSTHKTHIRNDTRYAFIP